MNAIELPKLKQGDLLYVTLNGSKMQCPRGEPVKGTGWLLVCEVSVDGEVIQANFCPQNQTGPYPGGYGAASLWPDFTVHAFLRGRHGETSPWAAIAGMFGKIAAIGLT